MAINVASGNPVNLLTDFFATKAPRSEALIGNAQTTTTYAPVTSTQTTKTDSRSYQSTSSSVYSPSVQYIINSAGASASQSPSASSSPTASLTPTTNVAPSTSQTSEPSTSATGSPNLMTYILLGALVLGGGYIALNSKVMNKVKGVVKK